MSKPIQSVILNEEESAVIYYEKTLGENITTRKRASVIFYASQGDTITEIHRKSGCSQVSVRSTIKGYSERGIDYIYECSRGIKKSVLDSIETELLKEFEKNPPSSIPEAVLRIKEKFNISLTETPVRYWLKKRGFVTSNQSRYRQKQI